MIIESLPYRWLVDQHVPLVFFLIAFATNPAMWSKKLTAYINNKFSVADT